jgi:hypothetical protein
MFGWMATGLRALDRDLPRRDRAIRSVKNRIQECHQFGRSQHSSHSDTTSTPCLDDRPPAQLPSALRARPMSPDPVTVLILLSRLFALLGGLSRHGGRHRRGSRRRRRRSRRCRRRGLRDRALVWHRGPTGLVPMACPSVRADADAFADPYRSGSQHAAQLAALWQVEPLMRPQREVLVIAGEHASVVSGAVSSHVDRPVVANIVRPGRGAGVRGRGLGCGRGRGRGREPVVWIRPGGRLHRILPGGADPLREVRKLVAAALADGSERDRVPRQLQRYLVWLPDPITAGHSLDGQHGTIYAAQRPHNGTLTFATPETSNPTHPVSPAAQDHDHVNNVSPAMRLSS